MVGLVIAGDDDEFSFCRDKSKFAIVVRDD
jgi:hypothetical protein